MKCYTYYTQDKINITPLLGLLKKKWEKLSSENQTRYWFVFFWKFFLVLMDHGNHSNHSNYYLSNDYRRLVFKGLCLSKTSTLTLTSWAGPSLSLRLTFTDTQAPSPMPASCWENDRSQPELCALSHSTQSLRTFKTFLCFLFEHLHLTATPLTLENLENCHWPTGLFCLPRGLYKVPGGYMSPKHVS